MSVWREPSEESTRIYPGLVVCDGRQSGSITIGRTRLPIWCVTGALLSGVRDWDDVVTDYDPPCTRDELNEFVDCLLDVRGEFARLLLELAAAERADRRRGMRSPPWWETKRRRKRVAAQLRRCLALVEVSS